MSSKVRLGGAVLVTIPLFAGLAATGGLSYGASAVGHAASIVHGAATAKPAISIRRLTSGSDQYQPGYGFGDPNHNHPGPPGLLRASVPSRQLSLDQTRALPSVRPQATRDGLGVTVTTAFTIDEQAHLYVSVIDSSATPLLLTQQSKRGGSRIGTRLTGRQTKFIQYAVLIPRTIPVTIRIPANLLTPNRTHKLRIVALDPGGNKSALLIPLTGG